MAAGYEMRVSDAERDAAAGELREHFASGRLDQEELDERLSRALTAKTRGDLTALFTDLPSSGRDWSGPAGPAGAGNGRTFPPRDAWADSDAWSQWRSQHDAWRGDAGRAIGRIAVGAVLMWVLLILGILGVFGIGTGRPFGVVLIIAAFALLRRLLTMIFGRRRVRGRGPHGRGPQRRR
jgi:hypothetical protein